jgi:predicted ATPase
MPFLKSFSINTEKKNPFPFNIAAIKFAKQVQLDNKVTIFIGDNGSGKSTLLESIALYLRLPLIGGHINENPGFEAAAILRPFVEIDWKRQTSKAFLFRAEDFSDFINSVENDRRKIAADLNDLKGQVDDSIINRMSESMNYSLYQCVRIMERICRPFHMVKLT